MSKTEPAKKKKATSLKVTVVRAVNQYHHRNVTITVPNDEYHQGLVKIGNLRIEED